MTHSLADAYATANLCEACSYNASQGLEPCVSCGIMVCPLCRYLRFPADPDSATPRRFCKPCDPHQGELHKARDGVRR